MTNLHVACLLLAFTYSICNGEYLICRNTADDLTTGVSSQTCTCKETTERIKTLEEQVRQLRRVIEKGEFTDHKTMYQTIPAGNLELIL